MLQTPLNGILAEQLEKTGIDWRQFLKERGLFAEEGTYELFESVVEPGQMVRLECYSSPESFVVQTCDTRGNRKRGAH